MARRAQYGRSGGAGLGGGVYIQRRRVVRHDGRAGSRGFERGEIMDERILF